MVGLVLGVVLFLVFPSIHLAIVALSLVGYSVVMLALGASKDRPGLTPAHCDLWGHDWRRQLPGLPAGTTCRNCLARKDGTLLAWRAPPAVPHVLDPFSGLFIAFKAPQNAAKRRPREYILIDDPRLPHIPIVPGQPVQVAAYAPPSPIEFTYQAEAAPQLERRTPP